MDACGYKTLQLTLHINQNGDLLGQPSLFWWTVAEQDASVDWELCKGSQGREHTT